MYNSEAAASSRPIETGDLRDSRARSETDLVCVAENKRVCRDLGKWERSAVRVRWNPMSRIRSASSNTNEILRVRIRNQTEG